MNKLDRRLAMVTRKTTPVEPEEFFGDEELIELQRVASEIEKLLNCLEPIAERAKHRSVAWARRTDINNDEWRKAWRPTWTLGRPLAGLMRRLAIFERSPKTLPADAIRATSERTYSAQTQS
jgi:hypothetical protein